MSQIARADHDPQRQQHGGTRPGQCPAPVKSNPRLLAMARELRDRWLERVNSGQFVVADGRSDVARIECQPPNPQRLLPAA